MIYRTLPYCQKCKTWTEPLVKNSVTKHKKDGVLVGQTYSMMCRTCTRNRIKSYYHRNKRKVRQIIYKSIKKHSHKQNARVRLYYALKKGKIARPDVCQECSQPGRIEGHHHDYNKPLEVAWLCTSCHAAADKISKAL